MRKTPIGIIILAVPVNRGIYIFVKKRMALRSLAYCRFSREGKGRDLGKAEG
jgi:hypothetical protein